MLGLCPTVAALIEKNNNTRSPDDAESPSTHNNKEITLAPSPTERHLLLHVQPEQRRIRGRMSNLRVRSSQVLPRRLIRSLSHRQRFLKLS